MMRRQIRSEPSIPTLKEIVTRLAALSLPRHALALQQKMQETLAIKSMQYGYDVASNLLRTMALAPPLADLRVSQLRSLSLVHLVPSAPVGMIRPSIKDDSLGKSETTDVDFATIDNTRARASNDAKEPSAAYKKDLMSSFLTAVPLLLLHRKLVHNFTFYPEDIEDDDNFDEASLQNFENRVPESEVIAFKPAINLRLFGLFESILNSLTFVSTGGKSPLFLAPTYSMLHMDRIGPSTALPWRTRFGERVTNTEQDEPPTTQIRLPSLSTPSTQATEPIKPASMPLVDRSQAKKDRRLEPRAKKARSSSDHDGSGGRNRLAGETTGREEKRLGDVFGNIISEEVMRFPSILAATAALSSLGNDFNLYSAILRPRLGQSQGRTGTSVIHSTVAEIMTAPIHRYVIPNSNFTAKDPGLSSLNQESLVENRGSDRKTQTDLAIKKSSRVRQAKTTTPVTRLASLYAILSRISMTMPTVKESSNFISGERIIPTVSIPRFKLASPFLRGSSTKSTITSSQNVPSSPTITSSYGISEHPSSLGESDSMDSTFQIKEEPSISSISFISAIPLVSSIVTSEAINAISQTVIAAHSLTTKYDDIYPLTPPISHPSATSYNLPRTRERMGLRRRNNLQNSGSTRKDEKSEVDSNQIRSSIFPTRENGRTLPPNDESEKGQLAIDPILAMKQEYSRYLFFKNIIINKPEMTTSQRSSASSMSIMDMSNSVASSQFPNARNAKKRSGIIIGQDTLRRMKDGSLDLPMISQLRKMLTTNLIVQKGRDDTLSSAASGGYLAILSSEQVISSPVPPSGRHTVNHRHRNDSHDVQTSASSIFSNNERMSSKAQELSRPQFGQTASSPTRTTEKTHKELTMRQLRKMMEQIFQDELKRYGL